MSGHCRVLFLFAAILVGLTATDWDDAPAAVAVWERVATLEDPDVDPVSPKRHLTPPHTDSLLLWCVPNAAGALLWHILPSQDPRAAECFAFSLRMPRAPPVEAPPADPPGCNSLYPPSSQVSLHPFRIVSGTPSMSLSQDEVQ